MIEANLIKESIERDGFAVVPHVIGKEKVSEIISALEAIDGAVGARVGREASMPSETCLKSFPRCASWRDHSMSARS
jgi:hypothetical protein